MKRISQLHGIHKTPSGISGFDSMTFGGLPKGRTSLVVGNAGSGKTTFSLQFLVNGAAHYGEPGIFVAFEERSRQIIENAASFGWSLPKLTRKNLFFLDARLDSDTIVSGDFELNALLSSLDMQIKKMNAKRIVFDSVDILLGLLGSRPRQQAELYRLRDWIADRNLTGLLTSKPHSPADLGGPSVDLLPYVADHVLQLNHSVYENQSRRSIRVIKYRGSSFRENEFPFVIDGDGLEVIHTDCVPKMEFKVSDKRLTTGVSRLDEMLGGGYLERSSVLITGAPGTTKSTLAGAFLNANCMAKRKSLFMSFDEHSEETVRNLKSVGIDLGKHVRSGLLQMDAERSGAISPEETLVRLQKKLQGFRPKCLVIDPISALVRSVKDPSSSRLAEQAIHMAKACGATILCTSLIEGNDPQHESTPVQISSVADAWIHVSYVSRAGERNRALTIIKSRGTDHSNQVRELILSRHGISLSDVYTSDGEVLMGTLRWQKEAADNSKEDGYSAAIKLRKAELELARTELEARAAAGRKELELKKLSLEHMLAEAETKMSILKSNRMAVSRLREGGISEKKKKRVR